MFCAWRHMWTTMCTCSTGRARQPKHAITCTSEPTEATDPWAISMAKDLISVADGNIMGTVPWPTKFVISIVNWIHFVWWELGTVDPV